MFGTGMFTLLLLHYSTLLLRIPCAHCTTYTKDTSALRSPSDYLLSSIAAPYDGDEVLLNAGTLTPDSTATFLGVLIFLSKAVSLTCKATSTTCVLNGNRNNVQIMQASFIALEETTFTRIKFYKGEAVTGVSSFQNGGALWVSGPTLVLNKCYFHWNRSDGHGGAIYVAAGRVILHGTTFSGSTTANSADGMGDEIYPLLGSTVVLTEGCPAGYEGPPTQGSAIDVTGSVVGMSYKFSYTCTTICPAGRYSENGNTGDCTWCPDGKYLTDSGSDPMDHDSEGDCVTCTAGRYAASKTEAPCEFCPAGTYTLVAAAGECTGCPAGKYNDHVPDGQWSETFHDSEDDCTGCEPGKYAPYTGFTACINCGPGRYSTSQGGLSEASCLLCPEGKYSSDQVRSVACTLCSSGTYAASPMSTVCLQCIAGKYSWQNPITSSMSTGIVACSDCAPGTYAGRSGQSSCGDCEAGRYSSNTGGTTCSLCAAGTYSSAAASECSKCVAGKFSTAGLAVCDDCEATSGYVSQEAASECVFCGPGKRAEATINSCENCSPGTYSIGGTDSCSNCNAAEGNVASSSAAESCQYCGPGKYARIATNICEDCEQGKFSFGGTASCTDCNAARGEVGSGVGATACDYCGTGKAAIDGQCATCPAGTFSAGGTNVCTACASDKYSGSGWPSCYTCDPGSVPNDANNDCVQCPAGKFGAFASTSCELCQSGTYSSAGASSCSNVPAGSKVATTNVDSLELRTSHAQCVAGTYSLGGADDCTPCEAGERSDTGAAGCKPCAICPVGRYVVTECSTSSDTQCEICGKGTASMGDGATSCTACTSDGQYADRTESSVCKTAPAGKKPTTNHQDVENCAAGTYSVGGANECSDCGAGETSAAGAAGCSTCAVCEPGKYKISDCSSDTETQCGDCLKGKASMGGEATSCTECDSDGKYSDEDNASVCKTAPAGKKPTLNRQNIEDCAAGKYSTGGANECSECRSGETSDAGAAGCRTCATCGLGKYRIADCTSEVETQCGDCVAGKASMGGDATSCTECYGEGQYSDSALAAACKIAPAGFIPTVDHAALEPCPRNFFSIGASSNCSPCENGGHSSPGSAACESCSSGKYYDEDSNACQNCPSGKFSASGASSLENCQDCVDAGSYSPEGAAACSFVPSGYIPTNYRTSMKPCEAGTYSEGLADECKDCAEGFVSHSGSAACNPCPQYQRQDPSNSTKCVCEPTFERDEGGSCTCKPGETLAGTTCVPCDLNKYKPDFEVESCTVCDFVLLGGITKDVSSTSSLACICPAGTFKDGKICRDIPPRGVNSTKIGMTLEDMELSTGYWRTNGNSTVVRDCLVEEACEGGENSSDYCRDHHWGPLCERCDERYSKSMHGICLPCEGTATDTAYTLLTLLALLIILFCIYRFVVKKLFKKNGIRSLKTGVKVMVSGWQIIVNIPSVVPNIIVPEDFEKVLTSMQFLSFDLFTIVSIRCWTLATNFYHHLVTATVMPLFFCALLALLAYTIKKRKNQFLAIALALTYLTFPTVSTTLMKFFPCDLMDDGQKWLRADYSVSCLASNRTPMAVFSVSMVCVYPIGVPALYFFLLWKNKARINRPADEREEDEGIIGISFLYESYKPQYWWFELAETSRRLMMTGILSVIEPGSETQLFAAILIAILACVMTAWCSPYIDKRDNVIAVSMNLQIAMISLSALALKRQQDGVSEGAEDESYDEKGIGILLIIYSIVNIVIFLFYGWAEVNSESSSADGVAAKLIKKGGNTDKLMKGLSKTSPKPSGVPPPPRLDFAPPPPPPVEVELSSIHRKSSDTSFEFENPMAAAKGRGAS
ncbi:hypothetical protein TrST_g11202 [Triparma strigata]|uniref:TNFR-Cys domain-containing protein n=1 Tax=Triparma strigata TaxID=1606541 RepID=A0A9W7BIM1_9STRA|nr:hypothetical protein TrST_g11202 [Triparma strigata]